MAATTCEICGAIGEVRLVAYVAGGEHRTAQLCEACKADRLARRRVRHRANPGRYLRRHRLMRALRDGGPQAWLGFGLLVIGVTLVPLYIVVALIVK